jgi:hypothetical protein
MVDLESIREISDPSASFVGVCYDDDFVAAIDKLGGQLVNVRFYASWLRKEEVANHSDVERHAVIFADIYIVCTRLCVYAWSSNDLDQVYLE